MNTAMNFGIHKRQEFFSERSRLHKARVEFFPVSPLSYVVGHCNFKSLFTREIWGSLRGAVFWDVTLCPAIS